MTTAASAEIRCSPCGPRPFRLAAQEAGFSFLFIVAGRLFWLGAGGIAAMVKMGTRKSDLYYEAYALISSPLRALFEN